MKKVFGNIPAVPFIIFIVIAVGLFVLFLPQQGMTGRVTNSLSLTKTSYTSGMAFEGWLNIMFSKSTEGKLDFIPENSSIQIIITNVTEAYYMCKDKSSVLSVAYDFGEGDYITIDPAPWNSCSPVETNITYSCTDKGKKCCPFGGSGAYYLNLECDGSLVCWDKCATPVILSLKDTIALSAPGKGNYTNGTYYNVDNAATFPPGSYGPGFGACKVGGGTSGSVIKDLLIGAWWGPLIYQPDLIVNNIYIQNGKICVEIKNIGNAASVASDACAEWNVDDCSKCSTGNCCVSALPPATGGICCLCESVLPLAVGYSDTIYFDISGYDKQVVIYADAGNAMTESNEENNGLPMACQQHAGGHCRLSNCLENEFEITPFCILSGYKCCAECIEALNPHRCIDESGEHPDTCTSDKTALTSYYCGEDPWTGITRCISSTLACSNWGEGYTCIENATGAFCVPEEAQSECSVVGNVCYDPDPHPGTCTLDKSALTSYYCGEDLLSGIMRCMGSTLPCSPHVGEGYVCIENATGAFCVPEEAQSECSGTMSFSLNPSATIPSSAVTARTYISKAGSSTKCEGKIVQIKANSCSGAVICTCTLAEGFPAVNGEVTYHASCSCNFNSPSLLGTYNYYVCADMDGDGLYGSGESKFAQLVVESAPPTCNDSDYGNNYYINGTCLDKSEVLKTDKCLNATHLEEWTCFDGTCISIIYHCPNNCDTGKGKCKVVYDCYGWNNNYKINLTQSGVKAPKQPGFYLLRAFLMYNNTVISEYYSNFTVNVTLPGLPGLACKWVNVTDWTPAECPATTIQTKTWKEINNCSTATGMPQGCTLKPNVYPFKCIQTQPCLSETGTEIPTRITDWKPYPCETAGDQWALFKWANSTVFNQTRGYCCIENWTIDWGACNATTKTRTGYWVDSNECETTYTGPSTAEKQEEVCILPAVTWQKLMIWILIIAVALVIIISAALYAIKRTKTKAAKVIKETAKPAVAAAAPATLPKKELEYPALRDYIKKARAKGMTKDKIKQELLKSGWPSDIINKVLAA